MKFACVRVVALSRGASRSSRCVRTGRPNVLASAVFHSSYSLRDARRGTLSLTAADHRCEDAGSRKCEKRLVTGDTGETAAANHVATVTHLPRMDIDVRVVRVHTIPYTAVT